MLRFSISFGLFLMLAIFSTISSAERPAPPPSKYVYEFELDESSLPKGVKARNATDGGVSRYFLKNESDVPLVIQERFQNGKLVSGNKLVGGKVYGYFPNGVPMEGKTHLKGWQAPFGDIEETVFTLPNEPAAIAQGREPGASDEPPKSESVMIAVKYGDKPYEIKGTVHYRLRMPGTKKGK